MSIPIASAITELFHKHFDFEPDQILPLKRTASGRQYFRLISKDQTYIAAYGPDRKENEAFLSFSRHFKSKGLPVPEIIAEDIQQGVYIQEDLGGETLYQLLQKEEGDLSKPLVNLYKQVLEQLALMQIKGGEGLDYSKCTPSADFDQQSMLWDLNYFKYFFLRLTNTSFDEAALEADFQNLTNYLLQANCGHFMFRDFQSRNIMIRNGKPWFIDYQGGRRGAIQYDVASLLFQPAARMSDATRDTLFDHYLNAIESLKDIDRKAFKDLFYGYALIRRLQTLGTYGFRGIHERYTHFLTSIPIALSQITNLFEQNKIQIDLPELRRITIAINTSGQFDKAPAKESPLTVTISSFSYKKEIPEDPSGNGGGFVFDCRFLNNPGRYEPYKKLTGRDPAVIEFLQAHSNIEDFLNNAYYIVDEAVENYMERGFDHLMVSFGCTGGQHRSVYSADQMTKHLEEKYPVRVVLKHVEQERKGWVN